jgi:hypothetical protein
MLRPVFDRKLDVLERVNGRFTHIVTGKHNVPCSYGEKDTAYLGDTGQSGRVAPATELLVLWDRAVKINENDRIRFTQERVAGKWETLEDEPLYVLIEGSLAAPRVNGVVSHRQARIARQDG